MKFWKPQLKEDEKTRTEEYKKILEEVSKTKSQTNSSYLRFLLEEAEKHVNLLEISEAMNLYKAIIKDYDPDILKDAEKPEFSESIQKLYLRLSILENINKAHTCIDKKELEILRETLIKIKRDYSEIDLDLFADDKYTSHIRKNTEYFNSVLD